MTGVTQLLAAMERGQPQAAEQLLPLVYDELRKLAAARLAHEQPGQTLDATALVHEAYLRLVKPGFGEQRSEVRIQDQTIRPPTPDSRLPTPDSRLPTPAPRSPTPGFDGRGHFFAAAATAMRRILIENARRKARIKHGGQLARIELADLPQPDDDDERLLALDEALTRLAAEDPQAAQVVELHHFVGLNHEQVAEALGITVYLARQKWTYARAWLQNALGS